MKKTKISGAYEAPLSEVIVISPEGCLLTTSTIKTDSKDPIRNMSLVEDDDSWF